MKCNEVNFNQPNSSYSFTKKCDGDSCKRRELSAYDGTKKLALAGGVIALASHGLAYGVAKSSLAGFKNRSISETAEILKSYQSKFSKVADMSKTTCSKFIKDTLKEMSKPKLIGRSVMKGMLIGAVVGLLCDSARKYSSNMDYKKD